ncbi:MAG: DUF4159 domain-containing protein [bacterium]|nr:DUF4159 domain-containing protein [bacterium]
MSLLYGILAAAAIPLVFVTLYAKTEKGEKLKLGSFFIIRDLASRVFRVRSLKDRILLVLRLLGVIILALLIFDPSQHETPGRKSMQHASVQDAAVPFTGRGELVELNLPNGVLDSFHEDSYFLSAMARNLPPGPRGLVLLYNPDRERLEKVLSAPAGAGGSVKDIIIFPAMDQGLGVFERWGELFYFAELQESESLITGSSYTVKKYFRPVFLNNETGSGKISVYTRLKNNVPLAFSFTADSSERRILIFSVGPGSSWGEAGLSGYLVDEISRFRANIAIAANNRPSGIEGLKESGTITGQLPFKKLLYAGLICILLEVLLFLFRTVRSKKAGVLLCVPLLFFLLVPGAPLRAADFKFIELDASPALNGENRRMFARIKEEVEKRTSVLIAPRYYEKITTREFAAGKMPDQPFLWIIGCKNQRFFSKGVKAALRRFIQRGGIVFIATCGRERDREYFQSIRKLVLEQMEYDPDREVLPRLSGKHPVYRSFFLLPGGSLYGVDISRSTRRTALIVSRENFKSGILRNNEGSVRTALNTVLYMLSGNYKSDQIHTRQILKRLKKRELFK